MMAAVLALSAGIGKPIHAGTPPSFTSLQNSVTNEIELRTFKVLNDTAKFVPNLAVKEKKIWSSYVAIVLCKASFARFNQL
jgi:hypothetical protein